MADRNITRKENGIRWQMTIDRNPKNTKIRTVGTYDDNNKDGIVSDVCELEKILDVKSWAPQKHGKVKKNKRFRYN